MVSGWFILLQVWKKTKHYEWGGAISPDGKWIAYVSDESNRQEIYIQPFPALGRKRQVSIEGGTAPVWGKNGRELFFMPGRDLMR
jgi:Tol biopolymer transport system component